VPAAAIDLHHDVIAEFGGSFGIRDQSLLESALMAPQHLYYYSAPKPTLEQLAACYAYSLTRNHPFFDGNKRISLVVCELFLFKNGLLLQEQQLVTADTFEQLARRAITQEQLTDWIAARVVQRSADATSHLVANHILVSD
jgi:death on curing protein